MPQTPPGQRERAVGVVWEMSMLLPQEPLGRFRVTVKAGVPRRAVGVVWEMSMLLPQEPLGRFRVTVMAGVPRRAVGVVWEMSMLLPQEPLGRFRVTVMAGAHRRAARHTAKHACGWNGTGHILFHVARSSVAANHNTDKGSGSLKECHGGTFKWRDVQIHRFISTIV